MKISNYTYLTEIDNILVIYNSFNRVILKIELQEKINEIKKILQNPNDSLLQQTENYNTLKQYGIIIEDDINEKAIIDTQYLRDIMGSRLDLTIMPTEDCNFRCRYCYESFKNGKMSLKNVYAFEKFIYKNLRKYTEVSVSWFGGEPLEALEQMEMLSNIIISSCKKRKIPYNAGIVTNGYNLTPDVLKHLIDMRVTQIQVTLDGTKTNHDKYKVHRDGLPTFDTVMNNLVYIKNNCHKRTLSIVIRTNVSKDLLSDLDSIIEMYYNKFADDNRFSFFFRPVGDWGGENIKSISSSIFNPSQFNLVYKKIAENNTILNYKMYYKELTEGIDICYAAKDNAYIIGSDLKIYKCSCKFDDLNNHIGNLKDNGIMLLNDNLSSKWLSIGRHPSEKCSKCILYPVCHNSACIADAVNNKIEGSVCPHMKNNLNYYLKILSKDSRYVKSI